MESFGVEVLCVYKGLNICIMYVYVWVDGWVCFVQM